MSNLLTYKGYKAEVTFDADRKLLVGRILKNGPEIVFSSKSVSLLFESFESEVDSILHKIELTNRVEQALTYADSKFESGNGYIELDPEESDTVIAAKLRACMNLADGESFRVFKAT